MSSLSVISGIAAAAAGLAGDNVGKDGAIAGLDIAGIITALSGKSSGAGLLAELASTVAKS